MFLPNIRFRETAVLPRNNKPILKRLNEVVVSSFKNTRLLNEVFLQ